MKLFSCLGWIFLIRTVVLMFWLYLKSVRIKQNHSMTRYEPSNKWAINHQILVINSSNHVFSFIKYYYNEVCVNNVININTTQYLTWVVVLTGCSDILSKANMLTASLISSVAQRQDQTSNLQVTMTTSLPLRLYTETKKLTVHLNKKNKNLNKTKG